MIKSRIIAIDFDGTLVTHAYPSIGRDIGATIVVNALSAVGHRIILFTMRSGKELDEAVEWCKDSGIDLWAVNDNPEQTAWTDSRKIFAHAYIDDAAIGVPLVEPENARPFVDWPLLEQLLIEANYLPE